MTVPTTEKIAVMQAALAGYTIERAPNSVELAILKPVWTKDYAPKWNWDAYIYRVAREPREWWVNVYENGWGGHWKSKEAAVESRECGRQLVEIIHLREVIE